MPTLPPTHRRGGMPRKIEYERSRRSARHRGYNRAWELEAARYLRQSPLCRYCALDGRTTVASVVDHLYPHRGDQSVFWFRQWWISSCRSCHSGFKQAVERQGRAAIDTLARRLGVPIWPAGVSGTR